MPRVIKGNGPRGPTVQDIDPMAIEKAMWGEIAQHPIHLGGWALAAIGGTAVVTLGGPVAALMCVGGGFAAISSLIANGFLRYDTFHARQTAKMLAEHRQQARVVIDDLIRECEKGDFTDGPRECEDLWKAYEGLIRLLDENAELNDPEAIQYRNLASNLFNAGVINLLRALDLYMHLQEVDESRLQEELDEFRAKKRKAKDDKDKTILDQQIEDHEQRLERRKESQRKFDGRMVAANKIEGNFDAAASLLADLGIGTSGQHISWTNAAGELRGSVDAAIESNREFEALSAGK